MNIKGIQKTSLIDFPHTISSVLFSGGCNLRCKYCYNSELALDSSTLEVYPTEYILEMLRQKKGRIDGVTISGGEPTLRENLPYFIQAIKELQLKVKLDTNGFNPAIVEKLVTNQTVDYVAVDIKTSPDKYQALTGTELDFSLLEHTVDILRSSHTTYEMRTTCIPGYVTLEDFKAIHSRIGNVQQYYLQQFINEHTLDQELLHYTPYSKATLFQLKDYVATFAEICAVRGI